jgi:hypothetical protein
MKIYTDMQSAQGEIFFKIQLQYLDPFILPANEGLQLIRLIHNSIPVKYDSSANRYVPNGDRPRIQLEVLTEQQVSEMMVEALIT